MRNARGIVFGVALALLPMLAAPPAAADTSADERVKSGVTAWQAGNYAGAVAIWRPLAQAGNADAQFNLAQAYRLGHGVAADPQAAMGWYRKAAEQNHQQAQTTYGLMLFQNNDQKAAMPWLQKAADRGDPRALYVIGTALFNGDQLPKDWVRAYAMMTRAAAAGLPQARTSLGEMEHYIPASQRQQGTRLAEKIGGGGTAAPTAPPPAARTGTRSTSATPDRATPPPRTATRSPTPPPVRAAPDGGWRVQLGAYGNPQRATQLWHTLSRRLAPLAGKQPYFVKAGPVTRVQAGPFPDRAAAQAACAAAQAAGQGCFAFRTSP